MITSELKKMSFAEKKFILPNVLKNRLLNLYVISRKILSLSIFYLFIIYFIQ